MLSWQQERHLTVSAVLPANVPVFKALSLPTSLGITCAFHYGIDVALTRLRQALARGLRLVQVRETLLQPEVRAECAAHVVALVRSLGGITLINSDAQLASKLGAGLHLTSQQLMAAKSRPAADWCSASCHNAAELAQAQELGLDFVLLGPVQPTSSHPSTTEMGWKAFANLIRDYSLPVFALGGMRLTALHRARCLGAHGLAMVRGAWEQQSS
jgi:8-oxo-dGTP diphosphatase